MKLFLMYWLSAEIMCTLIGTLIGWLCSNAAMGAIVGAALPFFVVGGMITFATGGSDADDYPDFGM